jgi:hypothetical protein
MEPQLDEQARAAYVMERFTTFQRWKKRYMPVAYACSAVGFLIVLIGLYKLKPEFSFGVPVAAIGALIGLAIGMMVIMPRLPMPSLRCPFCSERVPLMAPPQLFKPFTAVKQCPNCQRALP